MADETSPAAIDRIERAIVRIEAAVLNRERASAALAERHEVLRARIENAIRDLDAVIAGQNGTGDDSTGDDSTGDGGAAQPEDD